MPDTKSLLASRTVWGALLAILASGLGLLGYTVTPADQVEAVAIGTSLVSAIGGAIALYGRIKATKRIG